MIDGGCLQRDLGGQGTWILFDGVVAVGESTAEHTRLEPEV